MKLKHRSSVYVVAILITFVVPRMALAEASQRDGIPQLILLTVGTAVFVILAAYCVWNFLLTSVEVDANSLVVRTLLRRRKWRFPDDVKAIIDGGDFYTLEFLGDDGSYKFSSGLYGMKGTSEISPFDAFVADARTRIQSPNKSGEKTP